MSYNNIVKKYLKDLQGQYKNAVSSGQYTAELSYRMPLDAMVKSLAKEFNPDEHIDVVLEPSKQGQVGRPDWRIHNQDTMGVYGYIEGKGLSTEPFDTAPYQPQIGKYLTLGHKLIITDGIDFVFCMDKDKKPTVISLINKGKMNVRDWSSQPVNQDFEIYMRDFFRNPAPQQVNESKLVELVAIRTRMLADDILEYANILPDEAMNDDETNMIQLLQGMRELVYSHNDSNLRTSEVFAGFVAQIIMFCLLYAHRVLCSENDTPVEKERKISNYIREDLSEGEALSPFRNLMLYLRDNAKKSIPINQRIDECIKFLSFVKISDEQLMHPDYHQLFELFLSKYDQKSRFDFGAYYTPKILVDFVVKLINHVVSVNFPGKSIYDDGNTIIDPCCGTGAFIEELIAQDKNDGAYNLCGIEILPAPYMLANYRMAILNTQKGNRRSAVNIILANTLNNTVFNGEGDKNSIEGRELLQASKLSSLPLKLVIGNPPCSDTLRINNTMEFSIINELMNDFRPPENLRRSRQNIQKQINNPFMQFLRWGCKKLIDSHNHSVLSFIVPLSFLEAESYRYARKYLSEHFSDVWAVAVDTDARTGERSSSLFHTLQGRAILILARHFGQECQITKFHYSDFSHCLRIDKERMLSDTIENIVSRFTEHPLDLDNFSFAPAQPFNTAMYSKFWPVSDETGWNAIFLNHCSGIKLAPTAIFTHVKAPMLKRRSREIASGDVESSYEWFSKQDKPPKAEKIVALKNALNQCGDRAAMDRTLSDNIKCYSFRPFLTSNVLLWKDVLHQYSRIGGGGTRLRPEIISAYENGETIGFAMAHTPRDLNPTLSQFVSFCWYYPDNDMCTRGNSHIYMNQYPNKQGGGMVANIAPNLLRTVSSMLEESEAVAAKHIVFYVYAILCSQVYLDEFEGALFTPNQSDKRARVPVVADKRLFNEIARMGEKIANLEKIDYQPENILGFDYEYYCSIIPKDFHLKNQIHPFDEENEQLLLTDGNFTITLSCPLSLQRLNISGYDVIKGVWLKFNSYDFTHCIFTPDDMKRLLNFLNTIATHEKLVKELDELIFPILCGNVSLHENVL